MNGDILPITDEQAQAVQEAFKFGGQSLELARYFAAYVTSILGTVPEDLVGLLGGDWLRAKRAENINRVFESARAHLNAAGVEAAEAVSLSVAIPLLRGAADEDRGDLVDLWGSLLAAAMTPGLSTRVRRSFAETLQRMEPLDARVFQGVQQYQSFAGGMRDALARDFGVGSDQIELSFRHLNELGVAYDGTVKGGWIEGSSRLNLTVFGREMLAILK